MKIGIFLFLYETYVIISLYYNIIIIFMDFKAIKEKAIKFKNNSIASGAKKLSESSLVIKKIEDLEKHISKSKNITFTSKDTWETKTGIKHSIIIFTEKDSDFYKDALVIMPVLMTKAWTSWIALKISDIDLKDLKKYNISKTPSLALFTNEKLVKVITWDENIKTIVKTLDLDIIKAIENIK